MYDYEIDNIVNQYNYNLPSKVFTAICNNSSQIVHVKYDPGTNLFDIWTNTDRHWTLRVFNDENIEVKE
jgi:hypothetical protein